MCKKNLSKEDSMQKKILLVLAVCCLFAVFSEANVYKGSCPSGGAKAYTFTPDFTGTVLLTLIFESPSSDLDIRMAAPNSSGDLTYVAFSESELRQFESLQIGVLGGVKYTLYIFSSHGSSAYRLNFDGTFTTSSGTGPAGSSARVPALREIQVDDATLKFLQKSHKLAK